MLMFALDVIRTFLSLIDKMVYWFLDMLISLFDTLATIQLFDSDVINTFASRIYVFVAVIMIFKVSFSIIQYIINPDTFSDNEKGMGKMIRNIILMLVALVSVQNIFQFAYTFQKRIINENVIPNIILGIGNIDKEDQEKTKNDLPFLILSPFVVPNVEISNVDYNNEYGVYEIDKTTKMYIMNPNIDKDALTGETKTFYTKGSYNPRFGEKLDYYAEDSFPAENYNNAMEKRNYMQLLDLVNYKAKEGNGEKYLLEYKCIISTLAGGFMAIMYINFCIDLAIRAAKLGFLELIAPIPIISMVDPKSSKSGMMSKWVKNCLSTYAGLFIRIAAVNFVIYIMYIIMDPNFFRNISIQSDSIFVQLMIIFGAFMFAKEAPKLISDLTGVDLKGDFKLNPFQRLPGEVTRLTSTLGAGAVGGLAGAASGAISRFNVARQNGHGIANSLLQAGTRGLVGGAFGGIGHGLGSGWQSNRPTHILRNGIASGQRIGQTNYRNAGTNILDRTRSRIQQNLGMQTDAEHFESDIKDYEEYAKIFDQMKAAADNNKFKLNMIGDMGLSQTAMATGLGFSSIKAMEDEGVDDTFYKRLSSIAGSEGTKGLKEYYEALQNSGTATDSQVRAAKMAYEKAQETIIDHAHDTRYQSATTNGAQIANLKAYAAQFSATHRYDDSLMTQKADDTFANFKLGAVNARKEVESIRYGQEDRHGNAVDTSQTFRHRTRSEIYERARRADEAVRNGNNNNR